MRIRLVIDLQYPTASTAEQEELIKHRLSAQVMSAARMNQFNVAVTDDLDAIAVEEVMVGCARVEDVTPVKKPPVKPESNIYGDEDGDYWFASGHLSVDDMVDAVIKWETEVADAIDLGDVDRLTHKTYYVVEDPDNSEMYKPVDGDFPGAQPMTSIRRA